DRGDAHQGRESSDRYEAALDGMPALRTRRPQEEVGAAEVHRAEDHRRQRWLDVPREEPACVGWPRHQDGERYDQERNDRDRHPSGHRQDAVVALWRLTASCHGSSPPEWMGYIV